MNAPQWNWPIMPCMREWAMERGLIPAPRPMPEEEEKRPTLDAYEPELEPSFQP